MTNQERYHLPIIPTPKEMHFADMVLKHMRVREPGYIRAIIGAEDDRNDRSAIVRWIRFNKEKLQRPLDIPECSSKIIAEIEYQTLGHH